MARRHGAIRPSIRGFTPSAFAALEGVDRGTVWRWVDRRIVEVSRLAPHAGVRVRYMDEDAQRALEAKARARDDDAE